MVVANSQTLNRGRLRQDIDPQAMTYTSSLTYDEHKAAEAAFQGLPLDPAWTNKAQVIYHGIREAMLVRDAQRATTAEAEQPAFHELEPVLF